MELQNIDIREEYYTDIHNMKPKWWMRWGILFLFLIVAIVFMLGYMVKYPDVIICDTILATNKPSVTLPFPPGSQIEKLLAANRADVMPNTALVVIRNNADYKDILSLEKALDHFSFRNDSINMFFESFINRNLHLGDVVENDWTAFSNELLIFYKINKMDSFKSQIQYLNNELKEQSELRAQYERLVAIDKMQKGLIRDKAAADSVLYSKQVTSKLEYNSNKQFFYSKNSELEQNRLALNRTNLEITRLQNAISNYGHSERESLLTQQLSMRKALNKLKTAIESWKKNFMLISPIAGKVYYIQNLEKDKYFEGNGIVVIPNNNSFYATINIPIVGAGKVRVGQKVIVKLNDYPYREYGVLEGELLEFSPVSKEKFYLGKVKFSDVSLSSYGKKIKIKENMSGVGEIVTNDRNLLERLFQTILYVFNKK